MPRTERCFCGEQFSKKAFRIHKKHCKKRKAALLRGKPYVAQAFSIINKRSLAEVAIAGGRPIPSLFFNQEKE